MNGATESPSFSRHLLKSQTVFLEVSFLLRDIWPKICLGNDFTALAAGGNDEQRESETLSFVKDETTKIEVSFLRQL